MRRNIQRLKEQAEKACSFLFVATLVGKHYARMELTSKICYDVVVALFEASLFALDIILLLGFSLFNETPLPGEISVVLMSVLDSIAFALAWRKPKAASILLASTTVVTLFLCLLASDRHSIRSLWCPEPYFGLLN
ncbi:MAG: hypothetical protein WAM66_07790 [Acidobacteriaceae bacterium]